MGVCISWVRGKKTIWKAGEISTDQPLIIVSNHGSMMDISALGGVFLKYHPKFIAKKELAKGLPSVSFNIRNGGSISIDRNDPEQALAEIKKLGDYIVRYNRSAVIFPEGTRTRDGQVKPFKKSGTLQLLAAAPSASVVPVYMHNYWRLGIYRFLPIPFGIKLSVTVLPVVERSGKTDKEVLTEVEERIRSYAAEFNEKGKGSLPSQETLI